MSGPSRLPWRVPALLFENQVDFAYVGRADLERAEVSADGVLSVGRGSYRVLVGERGWSADLPEGIAGRCVTVDVDADSPGDAVARVRAASSVPRFVDTDAPGVRLRSLRLGGEIVAIVFNESSDPATVTLRAPGPAGAGLLARELSGFGLIVARLHDGKPTVLHEHRP